MASRPPDASPEAGARTLRRELFARDAGAVRRPVCVGVGNRRFGP